MKEILIFIIICVGIAIYLHISEELKFQYNKKRTLRTCKNCGSSQKLVNNEWVPNKLPCKKCEI